jgi:hypothetical protein
MGPVPWSWSSPAAAVVRNHAAGGDCDDGLPKRRAQEALVANSPRTGRKPVARSAQELPNDASAGAAVPYYAVPGEGRSPSALTLGARALS